MKKLLLAFVIISSSLCASEPIIENKPVVSSTDLTLTPAAPMPQTSSAYNYAINALDEYVYKPILITFTERSVMNMEISKLVKLLNDRINTVMIEFIAAGKEAKAMQLSGASKKEIRDQQAKMADIFYSLRPAEPMLRAMYPKLNSLFDQLISLRENLDYSIVDTDIIVKDPAEKTGIIDKLLGR